MSDKDMIRQRTLEAAHLQTIEGNPLNAEQFAMFEMFDRERWLPERQRAYVLERSISDSGLTKAGGAYDRAA